MVVHVTVRYTQYVSFVVCSGPCGGHDESTVHISSIVAVSHSLPVGL